MSNLFTNISKFLFRKEENSFEMRASYDFTRFFLFVHNVPANARDIGESFWNLKVSSILSKEEKFS